MDKLYDFFLPHKDTHKKAHLISWEAILIYVLFFIALQVSFSVISFTKPGILGISSSIDQKKIIDLTNQERAKMGLSPVSENSILNQAAYLKAQNMFEENYWSHFAPSGKTPWDFILGSGYKFSYAGENLAKNFSTSEEVVNAWIASPSHKDNLLGSKYNEIGIAVVNGVLNSQQTTLVVQMFGARLGSTVASIDKTSGNTSKEEARPQITVSGEKINVPKNEIGEARPRQIYTASLANQKSDIKPILNPYQFFKTLALLLITFLAVILVVDLLVLSKRGVFRISSNHIAHMSLLAISAATLVTSSPGAIL